MKIGVVLESLRSLVGLLFAFPAMVFEFVFALDVLAVICCLPVCVVIPLLFQKPGLIPAAVYGLFTQLPFLSPYPLWMEMAICVAGFTLFYNIGFNIMPPHRRSLYLRMHPKAFVRYIFRQRMQQSV